MYSLIFEIVYPVLEIFSGSDKLKNHDPFFPGEYGSIENIESKVIVFYKVTDDRLFNLCLWKTKNKYF